MFIHFIEDGKIIPEVGSISAGGECTGLTPLTDGVTLELEVSFEIKFRIKCHVSVVRQGFKCMCLCM